jgi:hypothetical protein
MCGGGREGKHPPLAISGKHFKTEQKKKDKY